MGELVSFTYRLILLDFIVGGFIACVYSPSHSLWMGFIACVYTNELVVANCVPSHSL